jgi:riboflavin kinase/FMN adenylyltransferase
MQQTALSLGEPYSIVGKVIHGKKIGREIGYPTVNMEAEEERIYPPNGVYVTKVQVYNQMYMGITNIGYNPTVQGKEKVIETHILDFTGDLYGKEIQVYFYSFIREEKKFDSLEALTKQLIEDEKTARILFQTS